MQNFNLTDDGNQLILENNKLTLIVEAGVRVIGFIFDTPNGVVYTKEVKEGIHTFRKTDSWGLNWCVLEQLKDDAIIRITSDKAIYKITVGDAKKSGSFLWFKTEGFERQFFVPKQFFKTMELQ